MAKRLSKGKRQALLKAVSALREWNSPFWQVGNGSTSIDKTRLQSAQREAFMLRQNRAYMAIYC